MRVQLPAALLVCLLPTGCEEMETSSGGETGPRHGTGIRAVSGSVWRDGDDLRPLPKWKRHGASGGRGLSAEGICTGFPLDEAGENRVSGLPREGTLDLPSCDRRDREQDVFFLGSGDWRLHQRERQHSGPGVGTESSP